MATVTSKRKRSYVPPKLGPQVYSYGRFSDPGQGEGDSERRQTDKWKDAKTYAEKIGLPFNESLRMFDRGKSAFHGHHLTKGVFGPFLECIKRGDVAPGSVLVVEEIDRVSRLEPTEGLQLTLDIVRNGVTIYTPADDDDYTKKNLNEGKIWKLIAKLEAAHAESLKKSKRLKAVWEQKRKLAREKGKVTTSMAPDWFERIEIEDEDKKKRKKLVFNKAGKPIVIPGAAAAISLIFTKYVSRLGVGRITKDLIAKKVWAPPPKQKKNAKKGEMTSGWRESYVKKILRDRRVIGEYQPHRKVDGKRIPDGAPIEDYFPAIVDRDLFFRVQKMLAKTKGKSSGGRNDKATNILQKLVVCAYCGGPMHLKNDGDGRLYLYCFDGRSGRSKCKSPSIRYEDAETAVIENCRQLKPADILPNKSEQSKLIKALREKAQGISASLEDKQNRIANLLDQIETTRNAFIRNEYEARVGKLEKEKVQLECELEAAHSELRKALEGEESLFEWQEGIEALLESLQDSPILRQRLNAHLKEFIDRIEVFSHGHKHEWDDEVGDGDGFAELVKGGLDEAGVRLSRSKRKELDGFVSWALKLRMTTIHGRFLRIHFKVPAVRIEELKARWGKAVRTYKDVFPLGIPGKFAGSYAGRDCNLETLQGKYRRFKRETKSG